MSALGSIYFFSPGFNKIPDHRRQTAKKPGVKKIVAQGWFSGVKKPAEH